MNGTVVPESIEVTIEGGIALVRLNRPDRRNAIDRACSRRLIELAGELDADDSVEVVILTGTDPAFCGGVDTKDRAPGSGPRVGLSPPEHWLQMTTPVIGAINGACVTGGLELALACDFLLASDQARFADTHARLGLLSSWGLSALLPEAIGVRRAKELSATARFVDADEAFTIGLVNRVVAHDRLLAEAFATARELMASAPRSVREMFRLYDDGAGRARQERLELERASRVSFVRPGPRSQDER